MIIRGGTSCNSGASVSWGFQAFVCLLMLTAAMFLTSCEAGVDDPAAETPTPLAAGGVATAVPGIPEVTSPVSAGEVSGEVEVESPAVAVGLSFPRHGDELPVNRGDYYIYGELSNSGDCLRVSYADQVDPVATRDGLMVVWPDGFDFEDDGGVFEVFDAGGRAVARVGDSLRMSGRKVAAEGEWEWVGSAGGCSGPFWLVGDEVSVVVGGGVSVVESYDGVVFVTSGEQRGPIISAMAALDGEIRLDGGCLVVVGLDLPGERLVVWPPGFRLEGIGEDLSVVNGGGNVVARLGDEVVLGGRGVDAGAAYSGECEGEYFKANSVVSLDR